LEKQLKNTDVDKKYIETIVTAFYKKAVTDFLIGYQFRKIATQEGADPLSPPIEAFEDHLPRIVTFWSMQLFQEKKPESSPPFDLINIHQKLSMRKGELGRWLILFKETLKENSNKEHEIIHKAWLEKLNHFEHIFNKSFFS